MRRIILTESKFLMLLEATMGIDAIYEKHYSKIPRGKFDEICGLDPTFGGDRLGNYCKWLLSLYMRGKLSDEDCYVVKDYLQTFNDYRARIEKKDINQYKSVDELLSAVGQFINSDDVKSKSDQIRRIKQGAEKVYEDDEWVIIVPHTKEASIYYGKGAKWCTAARDSKNKFADYDEDGPLYILISKTREDEDGRQVKFQFHFPSKEFKNSLNKNTDSYELDLNDGVIEFFKERENVDVRDIQNLKSEEQLWAEYDARVGDALYVCEHDGQHPAEVWDRCDIIGDGYFCCGMKDDYLGIEDPELYIIAKDGHRVGIDTYDTVYDSSNGYFVVQFSNNADRHPSGYYNILNPKTGEYLLDKDWQDMGMHFNDIGLIVGENGPYNNVETHVINTKGQILNKKPFKKAFLNKRIGDDGVAFYGYYGDTPTCYDINGHEIHTEPYTVLQNLRYDTSGYMKVIRPCSLTNIEKIKKHLDNMPYEFNLIRNGKLFSPKWWQNIEIYPSTATPCAQDFKDYYYILGDDGMPLPHGMFWDKHQFLQALKTGNLHPQEEDEPLPF